MSLAPIALFVYNRPWHTRKTIESLQNNELARESDLFIFSDASKTFDTAASVNEVRRLIRSISGFQSITIVEQEVNLGLAASIINGVTRLCGDYGRVIVLEDDLVTSSYFLRFMNDALNVYAKEERVMHVSGSVYPIGAMSDETFFFRVPLCWGWATWDRAWRYFRKSNEIMSEFDCEMRRDFSFNGKYHYWEQLEGNKKGLMNTWFIYWYASLYLGRGLALFPSNSLVKNIGMDGSGVHCGTSFSYNIEPIERAIEVSLIPITESLEAVERHEIFFRNNWQPQSMLVKAFQKIIRAIKKLIYSVR